MNYPAILLNKNLPSFFSHNYSKVEYLNAKGSFLDPHTIKAVLQNGTEVHTQ